MAARSFALRFLLFAFLLGSIVGRKQNAAAQSTVHPSSFIVHPSSGTSLPLLIVWPREDATVDGDRVRVGGRTDPHAQVSVNGKRLPVFPSGAFAGTCPLKPGENRLLFRTAKGDLAATGVRTVRRTPPLRELPRTPVRFDPNYEGEPSEDVEVRPGDTIYISVKGSLDQSAWFCIGTSEERYPLFAVAHNGIGGFYEGAYQVRPTDRFSDVRLTCYLGPAKGKPLARKQMRGRITANTRPFPTVGYVREDFARLRAEPRGGAPLAMAREGTCLAIDGRMGNALRIALSPSLHGWLARDLIDIKLAVPPLRRGTVSNLSVTDSDTTTLIRIPLWLRVPFAVTDRIEPPSVELTLFGVDNRLDWIVERGERGFIETITTLPALDGSCRFYISVRARRLFGFRTYYQGDDFCLVLRHPPKPSSDPSRPLTGRTILLDPGHGGPSKGTVGSTGIEEKVVDFEMARVLRRLLEKRGATVRLTRSADYDVSLAERAQQAERGGDLFVSVHNNSITMTGDPLKETGVSVYYYHSQSREVAEAIYRRMLEVEPRPHPWGLVRADLYVVREITAMPSVLVECLFLSHPEDEMLLMDRAYIERDMEAVAAGITDWFAMAASK